MRIHGLTISRSDFLFFTTNPSPTAPPPNPSPSTLSFPRPARPTRARLRVGPARAAAVDAGEAVAEAEAAAEMSFYELLGIPATGSIGEIKQAYKQLARKYHPDVSPPGRVEEYTRRFIRVQEAYETLSDPRLRALYDRDVANGLHLAFSARRRYNTDEGMEEKSEWKNRWQSQLSELKRRSASKDGRGNMSWGARMRRRRDDPSDEL